MHARIAHEGETGIDVRGRRRGGGCGRLGGGRAALGFLGHPNTSRRRRAVRAVRARGGANHKRSLAVLDGGHLLLALGKALELLEDCVHALGHLLLDLLVLALFLFPRERLLPLLALLALSLLLRLLGLRALLGTLLRLRLLFEPLRLELRLALLGALGFARRALLHGENGSPMARPIALLARHHGVLRRRRER